jgi:hypothetical protein
LNSGAINTDTVILSPSTSLRINSAKNLGLTINATEILRGNTFEEFLRMTDEKTAKNQ